MLQVVTIRSTRSPSLIVHQGVIHRRRPRKRSHTYHSLTRQLSNRLQGLQKSYHPSSTVLYYCHSYPTYEHYSPFDVHLHNCRSHRLYPSLVPVARPCRSSLSLVTIARHYRSSTQSTALRGKLIFITFDPRSLLSSHQHHSPFDVHLHNHRSRRSGLSLVPVAHSCRS